MSTDKQDIDSQEPHSALQGAVNPPTGIPQAPVPVNLFQFPTQHAWHVNSLNGRHSAPTLPGYSYNIAPSATAAVAPAAPVEQATGPTPAKKKTKSKRKGASSKKKIAKGGGGSQYSEKEKDILLEAIETQLPIGQIAWQSVMHYFNARVPEDRERDERSLRFKFNALVATKAPTGDPNIPSHVLKAKEVQEKIIENSEMIDGAKMSDESGFINGSDEEDDDEENQNGKNDVENSTTAATADSSSVTNSSTTNSRRQRRNKRKAATNDSSDSMIQVFLETEKMHMKQARKREKRRERQENKNMKVFMGMFATAMNAFSMTHGGGAAIDPRQLERIMEDGSSSDCSLSSIDSDDSPPTKRKKLSKGKKIKGKPKSIHARERSNYKEDDEDSDL